MTPILPSGGARYIETGGASAPAVSGAPLYKDGTGAWVYGTTQKAQGGLYPVGGGVYEILAIDVPGVITDTGADFLVAAGPATAGAILADSGTDLYVTPTLTLPPGADLFVSNDTSFCLIARTNAKPLTAQRIAAVNVIIY